MLIQDPSLPALVHLVGPGAEDLLSAVVERAGGALNSARVSEVQYMPGQEAVVRYRCDIKWPDARRPRDVLLAAVVEGEVVPGTIPVVADTPDGELEVGVWRYPFDPLVTGLPIAVHAGELAEVLGDQLRGRLDLELLAYRPTQRAVVRVEDETGRVLYVKAVRPVESTGLAERHALLKSLGLPVADVVSVVEDLGLVVIQELPGITVRDRIKAGAPLWPRIDDVFTLAESLTSVPAAGLPRAASRVEDALSHAELLGKVVPHVAPVLNDLVARLSSALPDVESRSGSVVHGDLHEGQIMVDDDGSIVGLLDVDDLGPGDPLDDFATLIAHLRFRGASLGPDGVQVLEYSETLRSACGCALDARQLDTSIAAVLVGLATGPFRIQLPNWPELVSQTIEDACRFLDGPHDHGR